jgi:hypothetical protein
VAVVAIAGAPLIGLGVLARTVAIAIVLPIGFDVATRGLRWDNGAALVCAVFIQLFGPGRFALWPADEGFILRRLGER